MKNWYNIAPIGKQRHPVCYASLGGIVDGVQYVRLTDGGNVNFTLTQEEARSRYKLGNKVTPEQQERIEDRWQWELSR